MPCVWATARPVIRDYLENIICIDALQDLQPSELNDLYDMLEWDPEETTSEGEVRNKKSLLTWIIRNMPAMKADRRMETASLLKQSMQLRGVEIATPAASNASPGWLMSDIRLSDVRASLNNQPRSTSAIHGPLLAHAEDDRASPTPTPTPASKSEHTPKRVTSVNRGSRQATLFSREVCSDIDEDELAGGGEQASAPVHAEPVMQDMTSYSSTNPAWVRSLQQAFNTMDYTTNHHQHYQEALTPTPADRLTAVPRAIDSCDSTGQHQLQSSSPMISSSLSFYPDIHNGLQDVERAAKQGQHDLALEALGDVLGCLWVMKQVHNLRN